MWKKKNMKVDHLPNGFSPWKLKRFPQGNTYYLLITYHRSLAFIGVGRIVSTPKVGDFQGRTFDLPEGFWLVVSIPLKNMSSSVGIILPNIWKK
jgi:hypothetical protein